LAASERELGAASTSKIDLELSSYYMRLEHFHFCCVLVRVATR
jgi:hypothetical protein